MSFGYQVLGFGSGGGGITAEFDYLIVAGGAGSIGSIGGGGGAGGFRTSFPGGTKIEVTGGDNITVGAGGTPTATTPASAGYIAGQGEDITVATITSTGGGVQNSTEAYPAEPNEHADNIAVRSGGSGAGGGHQFSYSVGQGNTPPTSPSQGNPGGGPTGTWGASGGGGIGSAGGGEGSNAYSSPGGNGGTGQANSISGGAVTYASGGGGGAFVQGGSGGTASAGGGGAGGSSPGGNGTAGTANLGGGAGGRSGDSTADSTKNGGSGIVILSMPTALAPAGIDCTPGTNVKSTPGDQTVLTFTVSGKVVL